MPHTLTKLQFDLLAELLAPSGAQAVPDAAVVRELEGLGYLDCGRPTLAGRKLIDRKSVV